MFWNGKHRDRRLIGKGKGGRHFTDERGWRSLGGGETNPIDPQRTGNVFECLLAQVVERQIEPVADMVADRARYANPARFGDPSNRAATFTPSP